MILTARFKFTGFLYTRCQWLLRALISFQTIYTFDTPNTSGELASSIHRCLGRRFTIVMVIVVIPPRLQQIVGPPTALRCNNPTYPRIVHQMGSQANPDRLSR